MPPPVAMHRCGACGAVGFRSEFAHLGWPTLPGIVYDIDLLVSAPDRVKTMQVLRRLTGLDLQGAKALLQDPPHRIATGLYLHEMERFTDALRAVGAECSAQAREVTPGSPASWLEAPRLQDANDMETVLARLEAPGLNDKDEAALRLTLYHQWNAPFRETSVEWVPGDRRDAAQQSNAQRLAALLREDNDYERLLKANLARERADFASAASLLGSDFGEVEPLAVRLRALVEAKHSAVCVLG